MSYEKSFVPTEEAVEKLEKNVSRASDTFNSLKIELKTYCMLDHTKETLSDVITKIRYYLFGLKYDVRSECYKIAVEQYREHGEVWFCGWEHSHSEPDCDYDEVLDYVLEKLVTLSCVVKTSDWFDESEKFYDKLHEINSAIEYFCDEVTTIIDYEIMDKLKDYEEKDDVEIEEQELDAENVLNTSPYVTTHTIIVNPNPDYWTTTSPPNPVSWTTTSSEVNKEFCQSTTDTKVDIKE